MRTDLSIGRREMIQTFLNNVVAVEVLNQLYDLITQGINDGLCLARS